MPHCIVEYTNNVLEQTSADVLVAQVQKAVCASDLFQAYQVKTRAIPYAHYQIYETEPDAFVHVHIRILAGRTVEQKKGLSAEVLTHLEMLGLTSIALTVEVADIEPESYVKSVVQ